MGRIKGWERNRGLSWRKTSPVDGGRAYIWIDGGLTTYGSPYVILLKEVRGKPILTNGKLIGKARTLVEARKIAVRYMKVNPNG